MEIERFEKFATKQIRAKARCPIDKRPCGPRLSNPECVKCMNQGSINKEAQKDNGG